MKFYKITDKEDYHYWVYAASEDEAKKLVAYEALDNDVSRIKECAELTPDQAKEYYVSNPDYIPEDEYKPEGDDTPYDECYDINWDRMPITDWVTLGSSKELICSTIDL